MIKIENFNVDSAVIDITEIRMIEAKKTIKPDIPDLWHREFSFVDNNGRCITLRIHANKKEDLEIKERNY